MKYIVFIFFGFVISNTATSQELGNLSKILREECQEYVSDKFSETNNYCSGYFEGILEYKINKENLPVYSCFPRYDSYDEYKQTVIKRYILESKQQELNNEYVRAFNIMTDLIETEFKRICSP